MPEHLTTAEDLQHLSLLGRTTGQANHALETFPNHHPGRDYIVELQTDEFTCLCPATGQPDFAKIVIRYIPEASILESKSLKLYLWGFRQRGVFHEHVTNVILDDLVAVLQPRWCEVSAQFSVRGGISINVRAEHGRRVASGS